jgi:error-prone DNA polymerase
MVHPYLRRRSGKEPIAYPHALLEEALEETLGVILFQESVIKVARDLAGFTQGQGELLRRALGGKRPDKEVEQLREEFISGAKQNEVLEEVAEKVFEGLKAFGGYSFPKSHAAAFAVIVYQSAWLRHYFPAHFRAALLNHQPLGFWSPAVIVNDARRHGIGIRRIDINRSRGMCTVEDNNIRIGFRYVSGFGDAKIQKIEDAQEDGAFTDLNDFCRRTRLPHTLIERLILVGAMDDWGIDRRRLVWELGRLVEKGDGLGLVLPDDGVELKPLSSVELLMLETQLMGLTTGEHVMSFYEKWMAKRHILGSQEIQQCKHKQKVRVAGEVVMHQAPPTAKGFHFITLEDKEGMMNIIVRPNVYKDNRHILRHAPLLVVTGEVQHEGDVTNVICEQAAILPPLRN